MKNTVLFICFLGMMVSYSQTGVHNFGNLQVHDGGQLGVHLNMINDGAFSADAGLVGFYNEGSLTVNGSNPAQLFDIEFFALEDTFLEIPVSATNNVNFIAGNVLTSPSTLNPSLEFLQNGFFLGEDDDSKVIGFTTATNKFNFSFPVGDRAQLRPLLWSSDTATNLVGCAYFFENPSTPFTLTANFDTNTTAQNIEAVSNTEFWVLSGSSPSQITISWNPRSGLNTIANTLGEVIIVGWNLVQQQWVSLGNPVASGSLEQGFMVSDNFIPDNYGAITFGAIALPTEPQISNVPTLGNYYLSPNGDGINDNLIFDDLSGTPLDLLSIFNRFGQKVFEQSNYTDQFNGVANTNNFIIGRNSGLPEGIYYYAADLSAENLQYQGFFFLDR
ncbi:MAG: gliding motility-associated C-terminal domain-containing protein [Bacteroidota bacterium]